MKQKIDEKRLVYILGRVEEKHPDKAKKIKADRVAKEKKDKKK